MHPYASLLRHSLLHRSFPNRRLGQYFSMFEIGEGEVNGASFAFRLSPQI